MRKHYASPCQLYSLPPRSASSNTNFLRLRCLGKGAGTVNIIWTCQHLSPFRPLSILVVLTTRADGSCGFLTLPEQGQGDRHSVLARLCNGLWLSLWVFMEHPQSPGQCVSYRCFSSMSSVVSQDVFVCAAHFLESGKHLAGGGCIQFLSVSKVLPVWEIIGLFYVGVPHLTVLFSLPLRSAIGVLIYFLWLLCFCGIRIWERKMSVELFSVKDHWSTGKRYLNTISIVKISLGINLYSVKATNKE